MDKLCFLIMAGGKGTRFWPLSTEERPKQFLKLISDNTMIQMTVNRLRPITSIENIFICTGEKYIEIIREQIPDLPLENIIVEPYSRNTGPCIALSALEISKKRKDSTMVVLPSDHLIEDEEKFRNTIISGSKFIDENNESIITIGIKPYRPETGYGYINYGNPIKLIGNNEILKVNKFVEKPNYETAKKYVVDGNYLWNCGMFIWKTNNIINLIKKHMYKTYCILNEVINMDDSNYYEILKNRYMDLEDISIDYGVMEHAEKIYVVLGKFGWDDLGTWSSVERYSDRDKYNNVEKNNIFPYNSSGNIVLTKKNILLNNIEDLIIVETDDYIMISKKLNEQEIKVAKQYFNL